MQIVVNKNRGFACSQNCMDLIKGVFCTNLLKRAQNTVWSFLIGFEVVYIDFSLFGR